MPHIRKRFAEKIISKDISFSPCIALLGMRQSGKSTLLKHFSKRYFTFDDEDFFGEFSRNAKSLLTKPPFPLAIDEIQKHPPAFDALKLAIDEKKGPGKFLISGSVRFSSRRGIRESMTGRLSLINLLPMTIAETHQKPLSVFLEILLKGNLRSGVEVLGKRNWINERHLSKYLLQGGMPGICFIRDDVLRRRYFQAHLDTLLGRDIQLVHRTNLSVAILTGLLREIAARQGEPMNMAALARMANSSIPTIKKVLQSFEALFLIRPHGKTYFIEDIGLSQILYQTGELHRREMIQLLFHELRAQINYSLNFSAELSAYSTRGGSEIPFVVTTPAQKIVAIGVDDAEHPSEKTLKALTWFAKKHPKVIALALCRTKIPYEVDKSMWCFPWKWVF